MNKGGRPKGSKNIPKRTLDLRDNIPVKSTVAKFTIKQSDRNLLKQYNPEGLPDLRTKEFKNLSYEDKENYLLNEIAIAIENKKEAKKKNNIIGNLSYDIKEYKENYLRTTSLKMMGLEPFTVEEIKIVDYAGVETIEKKYIPIKLTEEQTKELNRIIKERKEQIRIYEEKEGYIQFYKYFTEELTIKIYKNYEKFTNLLTKEEKNEKIKYEDKVIRITSSIGYDDLYYFHYFFNSYYNIKNVNKKDTNLLFLHIIKEYAEKRVLTDGSEGVDDELVYINPNYFNEIIETTIGEFDIKKLKMKDAYSYNIEGYETQNWDTQKGRCVFDYIKFRYGNLKGLKIICNDDKELIKIFDDEDALINGVNTYQLNYFCEKFNIPLYAYDEDYNLFHHYYPTKANHNYPSMMFKIINNHFYPIPENKRRNLINNNKGLNIYSNLYNDENDKKENKQELNIIVLKEKENTFSKLSEIMKENNKIPLLKMYDNKISSFKINNVNNIFKDDEDEDIKKILSNMEIEYKGQTIGEIVSDIIKDRIKISTPNINVYNQLILAKKNRAFNGLIKDIDNNDNLICYDINKCYSSILYNPIEEWIILDIDNEWEDYNYGDKIKLGLYYIETEDNLLFKGNNIYSSAIVKKAIEENIKFRIIKALYAYKTQSKKIFVDIIDDILKITNNDEKLYKLMINYISGMMGKHKIIYTKGHINKSLEQVFTTLNNYEREDNNIKTFINKIDKKYYLYGFNKENKLNDINIPIYIQILDQSNIKLYDMIKKTDGELIGRKVDCAIIKNAKNKLKVGKKWGDYRLSKIPNINNYEINNNILFSEEREFKLYDNIIDSDDIEKILNICLNKGGTLLAGDAGTGKTFVINEISKKLNVAKITPTNKSALNIKGQTIHRFLKLNKDGKIPRKTIENIKTKKYDLIIIDEISMINKDLWKLLLLLKQETQINFLLVGDNKQLPPIEDDGIERDYFNSSIVKYLTNYNKINLEVKKRYDKKLSEILKDVENINMNDFNNKIETKVNICYFNKTRKRINQYWNNKEKKVNSILIKADEKDEMTQDIYLYQGLPLISRKTLNGGELMINNEKFILNGYDNKYLFLSSERPDEEGEIIIHKIDIDINQIHNYFLLNYCSTTHKAQGETITENFTIYDFNFMSKKCKYTALSRAKRTEQIKIIW
jgi:hypothetical protein